MAMVVELSGLLALVQVVVGFLFWAFGFRLFKLFVIVTGAFLGFLLGALLGGLGDGADAATMFGVGGAVLGGLIAWPLHKMIVFLAGAGLGFVAAFGAIVLPGGPVDAGIGLGLVAALIVGVVAVKFLKFFVIVLTALSGGFDMVIGAVGGGPFLLQLFDHPEAVGGVVMIGLLLGAAGIPLQYWLTKRAQPQETPVTEAATAEPPLPSGSVPAQTLVNAGFAAPAATMASGAVLVAGPTMASATMGAAKLQCPSCSTIIHAIPGPSLVRCPNNACGFAAPFPA